MRLFKVGQIVRCVVAPPPGQRDSKCLSEGAIYRIVDESVQRRPILGKCSDGHTRCGGWDESRFVRAVSEENSATRKHCGCWPEDKCTACGDVAALFGHRAKPQEAPLAADEPNPALSVAVKQDAGKPPLAYLAWMDDAAMVEVGKVLESGATKYDRDNWRKGFKWSRPLSASIRHIFAFLRGDDLDPETGRSHLAHAICGLMFVLNYQLTKGGTDDRWKKPAGVKP